MERISEPRDLVEDRSREGETRGEENKKCKVWFGSLL